MDCDKDRPPAWVLASEGGRLPCRAYFDPCLFAWEMRWFARTGVHYVGSRAQFGTPGRFQALEVGGTPLVLVLDETGDLRCMSNTCLHRGATLLEASGCVDKIQCPYHGWTYGLDGQLTGPRGQELCATQRLPSIPVRESGPMLFIDNRPRQPSPSPRALFTKTLPGPLDTAALVRDYSIRANWKLVVENFLECYHCPFVHRDTLSRVVDLSNYSSDVQPGVYVQEIVPKQPGSDGFRSEQRTVYFFFPATAVTVSGHSIVTFTVRPSGPSQSNVTRSFYGFEEQPETLVYFDTLMREDVAICERTQKGVASTLTTLGRYVLPAEDALVGFHLDYRRWLSGSRAPLPSHSHNGSKA